MVCLSTRFSHWASLGHKAHLLFEVAACSHWISLTQAARRGHRPALALLAPG